MNALYDFYNANKESFDVLNNNELKHLQRTLVLMLKDILSFCGKYDLDIFAGGGTALGAVREGGMIPWDDDIDLNIGRKEAEVFKKEIPKEWGEKYIMDAPGTDRPGKFPYIKVKLKGTYFREVIGNGKSSEIYIDIFVIDYASKYKILRFLQAPFYNLFRNTLYAIFMRESWDEVIKRRLKNCKISTRVIMRAGYIISTVLSVVPLEKYINLFDRITQKKPSPWATIPTGMGGYNTQLLKAEMYFEYYEASFEGMKIKISKGYCEIMRRQYGDYMTPPSEENRESGHYHIGPFIGGDV